MRPIKTSQRKSLFRYTSAKIFVLFYYSYRTRMDRKGNETTLDLILTWKFMKTRKKNQHFYQCNTGVRVLGRSSYIPFNIRRCFHQLFFTLTTSANYNHQIYHYKYRLIFHPFTIHSERFICHLNERSKKVYVRKSGASKTRKKKSELAHFCKQYKNAFLLNPKIWRK